MDRRSDLEDDRRLAGSAGAGRRWGGHGWLHPTDWPTGRDRGWVTAEMAFASLAVALAVVFMAGLCALGLAQIRCSDVAGEVAREAARDDMARVAQIRQTLPDATITLAEQNGLIVVHVVMPAKPWGEWLPAIELQAEAHALSERAR